MRKRPDSLLDSFRSSAWLASGSIGGSPCPQRNCDPLSKGASASASRDMTYVCICSCALEKHLVCGRIEKRGCKPLQQGYILGGVAWLLGCLAWWLSWWLGWAPAHVVGLFLTFVCSLSIFSTNDLSANSPGSADNPYSTNAFKAGLCSPHNRSYPLDRKIAN